jgi:23S rRNA-/tRNA-specific pseudouridylate synthase
MKAASPSDVRVLHRDESFLVVAKPSGVPTTSPADETTLVRLVQALDPRAPRLHPSSRLDAKISGVVIFARTAAATEHLLAARKAGAYVRVYFGLAARAPEPSHGEWRGAIAHDPRDARKRRVAAEGEGEGDAQHAHTLYRTALQLEPAVLLELRPQTGRTHQLRVHAAHAGVPLLGDRHYGGAQRITLGDGRVLAVRRTMLHCRRVTVPAMTGSGELAFADDPPADMQALWTSLGGDSLAML